MCLHIYSHENVAQHHYKTNIQLMLIIRDRNIVLLTLLNLTAVTNKFMPKEELIPTNNTVKLTKTFRLIII